MNKANRDTLISLLSEIQELRNADQDVVNSNLNKIQEADVKLNSLYVGEDSEISVFSPRRIDSTHRDEIDNLLAIKKSCQDSIAGLNISVSNYNHLIDVIQSVLSSDDSLDQDDHSNRDKNLMVLNIQEEERRRIARDLHDSSLQNLAALVHKSELVGQLLSTDPLAAKLEISIINKNLRSVIDEIRNTIYNLRPMQFDDLGIKCTIERLFSAININHKYIIKSDIEDVSCENSLVLVTLFRIIQECINNIVKHADADRIEFSLKQVGDHYSVDISDNGIGFDIDSIGSSENKHFGLSILRERVQLLGGQIFFDSSLGKGTKIHIDIPL